MSYQDFTVSNLYLGGDGDGTQVATITAPSDGTLIVEGKNATAFNFAINGDTSISGDMSIQGDIVSDLDLPYNAIIAQDIEVTNLSVTGVTYEKTTSNFNTSIIGNNVTLGFDISVGSSPIILGTPTTSITKWGFSSVNTDLGDVVKVTLILNATASYTYSDACSVNGVAISGGVLWPGGVTPTASNGDDLLTFTIITDNDGVTKVYGSAILNYS